MMKQLEKQIKRLPAMGPEGSGRVGEPEESFPGATAPAMTPPARGPPVTYDRHYVLKHAAELVGVSERMMRSAVAKGHVRGVRFGNRTLIPGSEVKRLVEVLGEITPLQAAE